MSKKVYSTIISVIFLLSLNIFSATSKDCDWFCKYGNLERTSTKPDGCMIEKQRLMTLWTAKWSENIPGIGNNLPKLFMFNDSILYSGKVINTGIGEKVVNGQKLKCIYVNCVDALAGKHIFVTDIFSEKYPTNKSVSAPFADDENIYVNIYEERIVKLNIKGEILDKFSVPGNTARHSPAIYKNHLLIGSGDKNLYCLDKNTGETIWKYDLQGSVMSEIAISDDKIFVAPQNKSRVVCLDLDGKQIWNKEFDTDQMGTPVALSDKILVLTNDGYLHCLNKENGKEIWRYKVGGYLMQFCATEDKIAIPTLYSVILLNTKTGEKIWENKNIATSNEIAKTMSENNQNEIERVFDSTIITRYYVLTFLGSSYRALEINTGKVRYSLPLGISLFGDKSAYFRAFYGDLVCMIDASDTVKFKLNEKEYKTDTRDFTMDVPPQVINGTTYIPAKYVVEPLGGQITWVDKTKTIKSTLLIPGSDELLKNNPDNYVQQFNVLEMKVNSNQAYLNNRQLQIDPKNPKITPIIINGRTMVPLRFLAESLGCKVEWKGDTKEIIVTYQP